MTRLSVSCNCFAAASAIVLASLAISGASAIELEARHYIVGNQMGAWYKPVVEPPAGWTVDEQWTEQYERLVLFENGDKSKDKPFMYVRAHVTDDMSLDDYVKGAQDRWLEKLETSVIEPEPAIERPGKPAVKMYLYKNPSQPEQAFEYTAFIKDTDSKNPKAVVFLQVVMAAGTMESLQKARPAFLELLSKL